MTTAMVDAVWAIVNFTTIAVNPAGSKIDVIGPKVDAASLKLKPLAGSLRDLGELPDDSVESCLKQVGHVGPLHVWRRRLLRGDGRIAF